MLQTMSSTQSVTRWPSAWAALIWCAAAASGVFWLLGFPSGSAVQGAAWVQTTPANAAGPTAQHLARAWGVQAPTPEVSIAQSSRFELWGVVAAASGQGSALIAVDGQPARAFKVGQTVADGVVLIGLTPKQAQLGANSQGPALFAISLPDKDTAL